jgi:hypothetical protein
MARSRGLGDVYKRQSKNPMKKEMHAQIMELNVSAEMVLTPIPNGRLSNVKSCF